MTAESDGKEVQAAGEGGATAGSPGRIADGRGPHRRRTCFNCGRTGHLAHRCCFPRVQGSDRVSIQQDRASYRRCYNCGKMGHVSGDCPKPIGRRCYNCGQEGHVVRDCPNPRVKS